MVHVPSAELERLKDQGQAVVPGAGLVRPGTPLLWATIKNLSGRNWTKADFQGKTTVVNVCRVPTLFAGNEYLERLAASKEISVPRFWIVDCNTTVAKELRGNLENPESWVERWLQARQNQLPVRQLPVAR